MTRAQKNRQLKNRERTLRGRKVVADNRRAVLSAYLQIKSEVNNRHRTALESLDFRLTPAKFERMMKMAWAEYRRENNLNPQGTK